MKDRIPKYQDSNKIIELNVLKDTLNRFNITGPEAGQVLSRCK